MTNPHKNRSLELEKQATEAQSYRERRGFAGMSVCANSVAVSLLSLDRPQREKSSRSSLGSRGSPRRLQSLLGALVFPLCPTQLAASKSQARPRRARPVSRNAKLLCCERRDLFFNFCGSVPRWRFSSLAGEKTPRFLVCLIRQAIAPGTKACLLEVRKLLYDVGQCQPIPCAPSGEEPVNTRSFRCSTPADDAARQ